MRFEVNNNGELIEGIPYMIDDVKIKQIIDELFNRNGWTLNIISKKIAPGMKIQLENKNLGKNNSFYFYYGKVRKEEERRSEYEKRIQLGSRDPREHIDNGIILGFYAYEQPVTIDNIIIVAYPINPNLNYPGNPSLRVNVEKDILPAKNIGFYVDRISGKNLVVFRPEFIYFYLENYKKLHSCEDLIEENDSQETSELNLNFQINDEFDAKFERNRIIFGAPGTGKSYQLKNDANQLLKNTEGTFERVTFYPDYSYSQFVGTYKPITDSEGKISYNFVPGPFLRVYVQAIKNPNQPHLLLIEEINRAKVASVFGDIFQLLDRNDNGISEYDIEASEDIKKYLSSNEQLGGNSDTWKKIRIPSNMFIWATMNSADQGVFPMDTAFKRRWNFEYLGINENEDNVKGKIILGTGSDEVEISWNTLRKAINNKLTSDYKLNEDKLIGPFFLSQNILKSNEDDFIINKDKFIQAFKSKVIMYLYEDAAKQYKHRLFSGCDSTKYSSVCDAFDTIGIKIFGENFKEFYDHQEV